MHVFFLSFAYSGKHYHRYTRTLEKFSQCFCVLSCKNFGRCHHCGLMTVFYGGINCRRPQQPFYRCRHHLEQVCSIILPLFVNPSKFHSRRFLLCVCKRKRQIISKIHAHNLYLQTQHRPVMYLYPFFRLTQAEAQAVLQIQIVLLQCCSFQNFRENVCFSLQN